MNPLRALYSRLDSVVAYDHCRVLLPWFSYAKGTDPVSTLRRRALVLERADACTASLPLKALAALLHPLRMVREVVMAVRRAGRLHREHAGASLIGQFFGAWYLTQRHNLPPILYFTFYLYRKPVEEWSRYLSHDESTLLLLEMRARSKGPDIWSKSGWYDFCRENELPTPPILALLSPAGIEGAGPLESFAGKDLFLKPDRDYSGRGGVLLQWDAAREGWQADGAIREWIPSASLRGFLLRLGNLAPHVVQERMRNAQVFSGLSKRALVNARVITFRDEKGCVSLVNATMRFASGDQVTSDLIGHTQFIPMDLTSGKLGPLLSRDPRYTGGDLIPGGTVKIKGLDFPDWALAVETVLRAHQAVHWLPCVGWDLVATDRGVMLLEGNIIWNGLLGQQLGLCPLGPTGLAAALLRHLEAPDPAYQRVEYTPSLR